ncbi:MAG TPA: glycosyltransferase family 2 protein [Ohtaekwangia sp.]
MRASVIIATYNNPAWLEKVLWGYEVQTYDNFEVLIADDGSGEDTLKVIERFKNNSHLRIIHVWHEDKGYRKCQILNKAIAASSSPYLIFTDGDCIPRADFVATHIQHAQKGFFLSGGAVRLPMRTSCTISREDIIEGSAFDLHWLNANGHSKKLFKNLKLTSRPWIAKLMNIITPAKATWNGGNSSGWKEDILRINGFDERMEYGGQDRELGERLKNSGIRAKQIRYSAICIHLDHSRSYKTNYSIRNNNWLRRYTRRYKSAWTSYGITKRVPSFA